jgi:hypothetical protein
MEPTMANALITPTVIANEMMMQVENNLVMANLVNRDYEDEFAKIGDTVQIRRPVKFTVRNGAVASAQDVEEGNIPPSDLQSGRRRLRLHLEGQDPHGGQVLRALHQAGGDPPSPTQVDQAVWGSTPRSPTGSARPAHLLSASRPSAAPVSAWTRTAFRRAQPSCMSPADNWGMLGGVTGALHREECRDRFRAGEAAADRWDDAVYPAQNVPNFTTGARGGTPLINGASQNVTYAASKSTWTQSLITDGWSNSITGVVKAGDVFTIAGVFDVNPTTRTATTRLKQFTVTADANSNGSAAQLDAHHQPADHHFRPAAELLLRRRPTTRR